MSICPDCGKVLSSAKRALYKHQYYNPGCATDVTEKQKQIQQKKEKRAAKRARKEMTDQEALSVVTTQDLMEELKRSNAKNDEMLREMREQRQELHDMKDSVNGLTDTMLSLKNNPTIVQIWPMLNSIEKLREINFDDARFQEINEIEYPPHAASLNNREASLSYLTRARKLQQVQPTSVMDDLGNKFYMDKGVLHLDKRARVESELLSVFARNSDALAQDAVKSLRQTDPCYKGFRTEMRSKLMDVHLKANELIAPHTLNNLVSGEID